MSACNVLNVRDFPQNKLNSEINASFLLNKHGDPHFLFYKFKENIILNNWEITGPTEQVQIIWLWVQIMFPLRDKSNAGYFEDIFSGT